MYDWSGELLVSDDVVMRDVHLSSTSFPLSDSIQRSSLRYLAVVDIARVPLYLAAGPSLEVSTTSTETEDWFNSILLDETALQDVEANTQDGPKGWWCCAAQAQSPVGVLAQVSAPERFSQDAARVTEILFYSTAIERPNNALELQLHALPLSSDLLYSAPSINTPPLSPVQLGDLISLGMTGRAEAQFLTPYVDFRKPDPVLSSKRKSVADIFDAATEWRRKARWKGEERVAAPISEVDSAPAMAAHRRSASLGSNADVAAEHTRIEADGNAQYVNDNSNGRLRPATASELCEGLLLPKSPIPSPSRLTGFPSDLRSFSRRGTVDGLAKRSSLSRVTSMIDAGEELTLESRNKDAISRLVMAGMRLYGLQQRKKSTKLQRHSITPEIPANEKATEDAARDEEYKLVYHQTYKGAVFAFRKYISTSPLYIHPDRLRATVDELLGVFCVDPFPNDESGCDTVPAFGMPLDEGTCINVPARTTEASPIDAGVTEPP